MSELTAARVALVATLGQLPSVVQVLLWLMLLDQVSGLMAAVVTRNISSSVGAIGLMRKAGQLVLLVSVHLAEALLPGTPAVDIWFATGFIMYEFLSILENLDHCGVPIPPQVKGVMRTIQTTDLVAGHRRGK